jgi:hypothetical protein
MIVRELLEKHFNHLSNQKVGKITELTFLYALNTITASTYTRALKELGLDQGLFQFRLEVSRSGRIHRAKTFLYQAIAFKDVGLAWHLSGLDPEDRQLRRLVQNPAICRAVRSLLRRGFKPISWPKLQKAVSEQYIQARRYAVYKVLHPTKGLNFVIRASQAQKDELVDELIALAVQNVYRTYPKLIRKKHILNIMKRSINNWVINMQHRYSCESNREMVAEQEQGVEVYRNLMQKIDLVEQDHPNLISSENPTKGIVLDRLQTIYKGPQLSYIQLLTGTFNLPFSQWLVKRGWDANDELFDQLLGQGDIERYCKLAGKFLGLSGEPRREFHTQLVAQV